MDSCTSIFIIIFYAFDSQTNLAMMTRIFEFYLLII